MSVEMISAVFTGCVGILTALAALLANRSRRVGEDNRAIRRQARELQRKFLVAIGHIFTLETELAKRGAPVPARPEILDKDEDDDDGPSPQRSNVRALP